MTKDDREDDPDEDRRKQYRTAKKALEVLREGLGALGLGFDEQIAAGLQLVEEKLKSAAPPEPRRCKEYLRAVFREKKGLLGIPSADVALYCRCPECTLLRQKEKRSQPDGVLEVSGEKTRDADLGDAPA